MGIVRMENVKKSYKIGDGFHQVLKGISLKIAPGNFIGLYGRSGCGKSTLMQLIGCLDEVDGGEYYLLGNPIHTMTAAEKTRLRREKIGYVFQSFNLISTMTVRENIEFPLLMLNKEDGKARLEKVRSILKEVELEAFENHFPDRLSGGQRQRVAIARALVKKPELIIADEPTANLDEQTSEIIARLLLELQEKHKVTVVCSSHDPMFIENATHKISIHDGLLVE